MNLDREKKMDIKITAIAPEQSKPKPTDESALAFGNIFTDYMFLMDYREGQWINPRIEPYHALPLDPAAMSLHYGQMLSLIHI